MLSYSFTLQTQDAKTGMVNIRADLDVQPDELWKTISTADKELIGQMKKSPTLYDELSKSLAPGVYGHEDVKRAVLLMLLGGVHKETAEVCLLLKALTLTCMSSCTSMIKNHQSNVLIVILSQIFRSSIVQSHS